MTHAELIAKQQMQIEDLLAERREFRTAVKQIYRELVCVGGPLNDNRLGYTKEQAKIFFTIKDLIGQFIK